MTSKLSFLKFNPPIFYLLSFHYVNIAKLQCLNLNFSNSASRKPREYQMPGFASVLVILCAHLSLIEATWIISLLALLFFSHAVSASCKISMLWLAQESCVNVRCLGFPASWWHYAPVVSIIEATTILTLPSINLDEDSHSICSKKGAWTPDVGVSSVFMTLCAFPLYYRSGCHYDVSHTATGLPSESDCNQKTRFWKFRG